MKIKTTLFHNSELNVYLTPETDAERNMLELMMDHNRAKWNLKRETYSPRRVESVTIKFWTEKADPLKEGIQ